MTADLTDLLRIHGTTTPLTGTLDDFIVQWMTERGLNPFLVLVMGFHAVDQLKRGQIVILHT